MAISNAEFAKRTKGKTAEVYIARRGTVTIVRCEGHDYMCNNLSPFSWIVDPVPDYWRHSIDWRGALSDYMCLQLRPPKSPNDWTITDYPGKDSLDCMMVYDDHGRLAPRFLD